MGLLAMGEVDFEATQAKAIHEVLRDLDEQTERLTLAA